MSGQWEEAHYCSINKNFYCFFYRIMLWLLLSRIAMKLSSRNPDTWTHQLSLPHHTLAHCFTLYDLAGSRYSLTCEVCWKISWTWVYFIDCVWYRANLLATMSTMRRRWNSSFILPGRSLCCDLCRHSVVWCWRVVPVLYWFCDILMRNE